MANNCWNSVIINGSNDTLKEIEKRFNQYNDTNYFTEFGDMVLNLPKRDYQGQDFDFYYTYGTKWWDFNIEWSDDETIVINGDSAWSPPLTLLYEMSKKFSVRVECDYIEEGMDFAGVVVYDKGDIKQNDEMSAQMYLVMEDGLESFIDNRLEWSDDEDFDEFIEGISDDVIDEYGTDKIKQYYEEIK